MRQRQPVYLLLFAVLLGAIAWAGWSQPVVLDDLRNFEFDSFQRISPPKFDPQGPVRIVSIDERSLRMAGQWPWPRDRLAKLVDRLAEAGAAAIGFDILFGEPDRTSVENVVAGLPDGPLKTDLAGRLAGQSSNDQIFAKALAATPSVLGVSLQGEGEPQSWDSKAGFATAGDSPDGFLPRYPAVSLPIPVLRDAAPGLGAIKWLPDRDQIVRRVPLFVQSGTGTLPSLAMESLRLALGASTFVLKSSNASGTTAFGAHTGLNSVKVGDMEFGTGPDGSIRPRYTHTDPRRYVSAIDVLDGRMDPDAVRGRIVLVGATAAALSDIRATPLDPVVPGVEVHAQVIEQMMSGRLLSRPDWAPGAEWLLTLVCVLAVMVILPRVQPLLGAVLSAWTVVVLVAAARISFQHGGMLLDATLPAISVVVAYGGGSSLLWQTELRARRHVRAAFGKFVSPAVVEKIADNPQLLRLSGETRELTILFSDLRNFSTISEALDAQEVASFLNGYLTPMTDVVIGHDGTVDKYIGDAIVAFWNAPLDVERHTTRAVDAALAMREALATFNLQQVALLATDSKAIQNVRMGIGLNVGACSVGNMGSIKRFDYSALGDPVNLAARLEALTKTYGVDLLATEVVRDRTSTYAWLEVDEVKVKGRTTPTKLFILAGDGSIARSGYFAAWQARHVAMLASKEAGDWRAAREGATELLGSCLPFWRPLYEALAEKYSKGIELPALETRDVALTEIMQAEWSI